MAAPLIVPVVDEGLGNSSYLVDLGDGRALAIDAPRCLRAMRAAARRHRLAVAFAADTHLHADFLSGARQLAADDDAQILAPAAGGRAFDHRGLADGDEADLGGLTLRAWSTPGHTADHFAYLLLDGPQVLGVFTGGSLLVGAAADRPGAGSDRPSPRRPCGSLTVTRYPRRAGRCWPRASGPASPGISCGCRRRTGGARPSCPPPRRSPR